MRVTETVILAAGLGRRLRPEGSHTPKPLVEVAGRSLMSRALEQAVAAGCRRAVVVVGSDSEEVRDHLESLDPGLTLDVVYNDRFQAPNGGSLMYAEGHVTGPFFLQMVDHVFLEPVLSRLVEPGLPSPGEGRLLVDVAPRGIDEKDATKVRCEGGRIRAIGKDLQPWDGVDAGIFLLGPTIFDDARKATNGGPPSVSRIMQRLAVDGRLRSVRLAGVRWADIDTPGDLHAAELLLEEVGLSPRAPRQPARTLDHYR